LALLADFYPRASQACPSNITAEIEAFCKKAKLEGLRIHDLRHPAATYTVKRHGIAKAGPNKIEKKKGKGGILNVRKGSVYVETQSLSISSMHAGNYCCLAFLRAANDAANAPPNMPTKQRIRDPRRWVRNIPRPSLGSVKMGITIPTAPRANMMGQSLKSAWGLPRDKRNWQIKKYAIITITLRIMAPIPLKIGATVSKVNINKK
jgi:hypothetical protein